MKYSLFAGAAAALVSMVDAYTPATGVNAGNPIYLPNLAHPVSVGSPFTITWDPTTEGTVTLVLVKGPAENVIPQFPIAEAIPNTGSYTWTPSSDLAGQETGYGIQLIVDATGDYQYTTQFGVINNEPVEEVPVASSSAPVPTYAATSVAAPAYTATSVPAVDPASYTVSYATEYETKTDCDCTETPVPTVVVPPGSAYPTGAPLAAPPAEVPTGGAQPSGAPPVVPPPVHVPGTEYPGWNSTVPQVPAGPTGTGSVAVPSNPASVPTQPAYTGAAGQIKAGGFMMAVVAIVAVAMF